MKESAYYTVVSVSAHTNLHTVHHFTWTTALGPGRAYQRAPVWTRDELRKRKVPGRSFIPRLQVTVTRMKGLKMAGVE